MATRQVPPRQADVRARLLDAAMRGLEDEGPEALKARDLTAQVGASTQAIYTCFGGMPGLFEAVVAAGFSGLARHVRRVPTSDDPVADFFAQGWAYAGWARAHPQTYRLMFGLTGGGLRLHSGLEMTLSGTLANFPEGQAAIEVMVGSLDRVRAAGRIRQVDPVIAAAQFLSATHGYLLLDSAGAFGPTVGDRAVMAELGVNLMVGLGDDRQAAERSLAAAIGDRSP